MSIGENIRKNRREKNITQEELATTLGIKRNTITQYEAGRIFPSHEILRKMASFFSVSMDELSMDIHTNSTEESSANLLTNSNMAYASMAVGGNDYLATMKKIIAQKIVYEISQRESDEFIVNHAPLFLTLVEAVLEINQHAKKADHAMIKLEIEGDTIDLNKILSEFSKELHRMESISNLFDKS